jgi:hypothetical protein
MNLRVHLHHIVFRSYVLAVMSRYFSDEFCKGVVMLNVQDDGISALFDVPKDHAREVVGLRFSDPTQR